MVSTNKYALELLKQQKPPAFTVVITDCQTAGKGIGVNTWESEPGKNLTFSLILYPTFLPVANQFMLNIAVSLAVRHFVASKTALPVWIKWPNDIYIENKKVTGILIQNSSVGMVFSSSVIGIGLNVNQEVFTSDAPNPVSLAQVCGQYFDLEECLYQLLDDLSFFYHQLQKEGFVSLNEQYLKYLYRFGQNAAYVYNGMETEAKIVGVDDFGRLQLVCSNGKTISCDLKELVFKF